MDRRRGDRRKTIRRREVRRTDGVTIATTLPGTEVGGGGPVHDVPHAGRALSKLTPLDHPLTERWRLRRDDQPQEGGGDDVLRGSRRARASRRQVREHALEVRDRAGRAKAAAHAARWRSVAASVSSLSWRTGSPPSSAPRAGWTRLRTGSTSWPGRSGRRLRRSARRRRPCSGGSVRPRRRWSGRRRVASPPSWSGRGGGLVRVPGSVGLRLPELPTPGDLDWLDIAGALRRGGVRL